MGLDGCGACSRLSCLWLGFCRFLIGKAAYGSPLPFAHCCCATTSSGACGSFFFCMWGDQNIAWGIGVVIAVSVCLPWHRAHSIALGTAMYAMWISESSLVVISLVLLAAIRVKPLMWLTGLLCLPFAYLHEPLHWLPAILGLVVCLSDAEFASKRRNNT